MQFEQYYLGCLAHASYLVGDDGECAIVDPQRDVDRYLDEAKARGLIIKHVIETHLHADFVSGHVELAERTGGTIHIGRKAEARFDHVPVADGDEIVMGNVTLRFLETPGHTPESLCVLVFDRSVSDEPLKVLTGDTLFIGDVGRPDLVGSRGLSSEQMAAMMYDSLRDKLMTLPDAVEVYPAHGAGSACGKNISTDLSSTIGAQKAINHALQPMSKEEFVSIMTTGLAPPPRYFPNSAELNRQGPRALAALDAPQGLTPDDVEARAAAGAVVLDVRDAAAFGAGHVPGSVNIGLGGNFAPWTGTLVDVGRPLVLVGTSDTEAVMRLARVGFETVVGYLAGGVEAWQAAGRLLDTVPQISVDELETRLGEDLIVLDVRKPGEHAAGHVPGAVNIPVEHLERRVDELDATAELAVICATGYRSSAATSLLARRGFDNVSNVVAGTEGWIAGGHETETEAAPVG